VDQQTEISRELTLWGQKGSRVIRGNLLAIPIEQSFLYVEPVYLQASQEDETQVQSTRTGTGTAMRRPQPPRTMGIPELKRVIVGYGNEVVMRDDLASGLAAIFEGGRPSKELVEGEPVLDRSIQDLVVSALNQYKAAQGFLRAGDWTGYGHALDTMETALEELINRVGEGEAPEE
jgi:uncharacterized membrane protein (UPF0182 family)